MLTGSSVEVDVEEAYRGEPLTKRSPRLWSGCAAAVTRLAHSLGAIAHPGHSPATQSGPGRWNTPDRIWRVTTVVALQPDVFRCRSGAAPPPGRSPARAMPMGAAGASSTVSYSLLDAIKVVEIAGQGCISMRAATTAVHSLTLAAPRRVTAGGSAGSLRPGSVTSRRNRWVATRRRRSCSNRRPTGSSWQT